MPRQASQRTRPATEQARLRPVEKNLMIKFGNQWSGIRESNPRLDLGKVAYYHYTNPAYRCNSRLLLFYSMPVHAGQDPPLNGNPISKLTSAAKLPIRTRYMRPSALIHFENARRSHHRRFLLPRGEAFSSVAVDINARESLAVAVKNRHLPVAVFAPLVAMESRGLSRGPASGCSALRFLGAVFLHVSMPRSVGIVVTQTNCDALSQFRPGRASN